MNKGKLTVHKLENHHLFNKSIKELVMDNVQCYVSHYQRVSQSSKMTPVSSTQVPTSSCDRNLMVSPSLGQVSSNG